MKQVPKAIVIFLAILYVIILIIQMNVIASYLSGRATSAITRVYVMADCPNDVPYLNASYPNLTWYAPSSYVGPSLSSYFVDADSDPITYTVSGNFYIGIRINQTTGVPTFTPMRHWWGIEYVIFNATDVCGLVASSNLVELNALYRAPLPVSTGGGEPGTIIECLEKWICTDWSECIGGMQHRKCKELNYCYTNYSEPDTVRECTLQTCSDTIKNCHDGACEENVDCGGPCLPCGTCSDQLKNCHHGKCELDVDCGGPCLPCQLTQLKKVAFERAPWLLLVAVLAAVFFIEGYIYYIKHYREYRKAPPLVKQKK